MNLCVFLHIVHLRSKNSTGGVPLLWLFWLPSLCVKKQWAFSKPIHCSWHAVCAHFTFNWVFDLKINEPERELPRYWEVVFLCAWSRCLSCQAYSGGYACSFDSIFCSPVIFFIKALQPPFIKSKISHLRLFQKYQELHSCSWIRIRIKPSYNAFSSISSILISIFHS